MFDPPGDIIDIVLTYQVLSFQRIRCRMNRADWEGDLFMRLWTITSALCRMIWDIIMSQTHSRACVPTTAVLMFQSEWDTQFHKVWSKIRTGGRITQITLHRTCSVVVGSMKWIQLNRITGLSDSSPSSKGRYRRSHEDSLIANVVWNQGILHKYEPTEYNKPTLARMEHILVGLQVLCQDLGNYWHIVPQWRPRSRIQQTNRLHLYFPQKDVRSRARLAEWDEWDRFSPELGDRWRFSLAHPSR